MVTQLVSPGVSISVTDVSAYAPTGRGTVPLIIIATKTNKELPNNGGIAQGTIQSRAEQLELVSSQRELVQLYGQPVFYEEQAGELNEYGLYTAYRYLGQAGPAYVLRVNVDLAELLPDVNPPVGAPINGTYWLDIYNTQFGIFRSNGNTNPGRAWVSNVPTTITDSELVDVQDVPLSTYGEDGDYAIVALRADNILYEKIAGNWYQVGSADWRAQNPVVVSGTAPADINNVLTSTNAAFTINGISVGNPFSGVSLSAIVSDINAALVAANSTITVSTNGDIVSFTDNTGSGITLVNTIGTPLNSLGMVATTYPGNKLYHASHTNVPTGSKAGDVWIKTTEPNSGSRWVVKIYSSSTAQWTTVDAPLFANDAAASAAFGVNIGVGTLYVQYNHYATSPEEASFLIKRWNGTSWAALTYEASDIEPTTEAEAGSLWFNNSYDLDIMVNDGQRWTGFNVAYPNCEIIKSSVAPTLQSDGSALVDNDLWISTADIRNYPKIYRWNASIKTWELIDNTDQTTPLGIVFGDARADTGPTPLVIDGVTYVRSTVEEVFLKSNHVDPDAPNPLNYPAGMLLFNTRYSTNVVKEWQPNWLADYVGVPYQVGDDIFAADTIVDSGRWVNITSFPVEDINSSGKRTDGVANFGYKAQRAVVVKKLQQAVASNEAIRAESIFFNLIVCPGYPELLDEMIVLNQDKKEVAFIIGDTPARLAPVSTEIQNWATNASLQPTNNEDGLATQAYPYTGIYYPWGFSTNPTDGQDIMIPPSTVALMTYAYNDAVSYPWEAPAGPQRGIVTSATTVGYLTNESEYKAVVLNNKQRDILYANRINPIAYQPGTGLMVYGQKTLHGSATALDRVNVARLICYLRYQLDIIVRPFLFEPNDEYTREQVRLIMNRFMDNMITLRAISDYVVVCDDSNNTPDRIDSNQLWIDLSIIPQKTIEFVYIPIRILNTGALSS